MTIHAAATKRALQALVGQQLRGSARAADMEMFAFGNSHRDVSPSGRRRMTNAFALHVQCSWRIVGREGIVTGYGDLGVVASRTPSKSSKKNRPREQTLRDRRLEALYRRHHARPLVVRRVESDKVGGARIHLSHGYVLELFPDTADPDSYSEYWRLLAWLAPGGSRHFVVTPTGTDLSETGDS